MPSSADLVRRWFSEIWNRRNIDAADDLLGPDGVLHETAVGSDAALDVAEFKTLGRLLLQAIPDVHFHVESTIEDGDQAAARVTVTGTHTGPGIGAAPTNKAFRITGLVMVRVANGRIVEGWSSFDMLGQFEQLGLVQRPSVG